MDCQQCGGANSAEALFCGRCGARLTDPTESTRVRTPLAPSVPPVPQPVAEQGVWSAPQPPQQQAWPAPPQAPAQQWAATQTVPPAAYQQAGQPTGPSTPAMGPALQRLLVGNWIGAALVAVAGMGVAGVLSGVVTLMTKPDGFGLRNSLTMIAAMTNAAFGANVSASFTDSEGLTRAGLGMVPLTISIITFSVMGLLFRRMIGRYRQGLDAVLDAMRVGLIVGVVETIAAIVFRANADKAGNRWGAQLLDYFGVRLHVGASVPGSLVMGFLMTTLVLVGVVWVRPGLWARPRVERVREITAPTLRGLAAVMWSLPFAGLVGLIAMILTGSTSSQRGEVDNDWSTIIGSVFAGLSNGGAWLLSLGAGGTVGAAGHYSGAEGSGDASRMFHLNRYADTYGGLWVAPVVLIAVLALATWWVLRTAPRGKGPAALGIWLGAVLVTTPFLVWLASLRGHVSVGGTRRTGGGYSGSGKIGPDGATTTFFIFLIALLVALVLGALMGVFSPRDVAAGLRDRFQQDPGAAYPPPGPQGYAAPAPGPQGYAAPAPAPQGYPAPAPGHAPHHQTGFAPPAHPQQGGAGQGFAPPASQAPPAHPGWQDPSGQH